MTKKSAAGMAQDAVNTAAGAVHDAATGAVNARGAAAHAMHDAAAAASKAADELKNSVKGMFPGKTDKADIADKHGSLKDKIQENLDKIQGKGHDKHDTLKDKLQENLGKIHGKAQENLDKVGKMTGMAQEQVDKAHAKAQEKMDKAHGKAKEKVDKAHGKAKEKLDQAQEKAGHMGGIGDKFSGIQDKIYEKIHGKPHPETFQEKLQAKLQNLGIFGNGGHSSHHGHSGHHEHHAGVLPWLAVPSAAIFIALAVVIFSMFLLKRKPLLAKKLKQWVMTMAQKAKGGQCHQSTILICGPVDAGKTLLFHTLSNGKSQDTQTSMEENVETFKIHPKVLGDNKPNLSDFQFEFIDFPGHPSQELKLTKYVPRIQGVILLVDASSNDSCIRGAKMLYSFLEKKKFSMKKVPILVCANKVDLNNANSMSMIREKVLDELNKLKESQTTMENLGKHDEDIITVGKPGEKLTWENLNSISFGQISVKEGNLKDVLNFLGSIHKH